MSRIVALGFATMFGLAGSLPAAAADLPNEGKFSVTFFGHGTYKGAAVGKTRSQSIFEYDGYMIGEGLLDHMTAHCMRTGGRTDQTRHSISFCIFTDKGGDQIAEEVDET